MKNPYQKEMPIKDIKAVLDKSSHANVMAVYLLGGEPTLHTKFNKILDLCLNQFLYVRLFTNGLFNKEIQKKLTKSNDKLQVVFNISTPSFTSDKKIRDSVIDNISNLVKSNGNISVSISSYFFNIKNEIEIINRISNKTFKKLAVRLAFIQPNVGENNFIKINDFPKVGPKIIKLINHIVNKGPPIVLSLVGGFRPCMLNQEQQIFLKEMGISIPLNCHSKDEWFHVLPYEKGMSSYQCYPLSTNDKISITNSSDYKKIRSKFVYLQNKYIHQYVLPDCKKCRFFGYETNRCSGPCVAFRINALRKPNHQ